MFTLPVLAQEIIDMGLSTEFTEGRAASIQAWLNHSMQNMAASET